MAPGANDSTVRFHVQRPDDLRRSTPWHRQLEAAGFEIVAFRGVMVLTATGLQLVQDGWYRRIGPARHLPALVMQTLIRIADRLEPAGSRELNALVYVLMAVRR